jgi:hypothetical protein
VLAALYGGEAAAESSLVVAVAIEPHAATRASKQRLSPRRCRPKPGRSVASIGNYSNGGAADLIVLDTFGKLHAHGYVLSGYCPAGSCRACSHNRSSSSRIEGLSSHCRASGRSSSKRKATSMSRQL